MIHISFVIIFKDHLSSPTVPEGAESGISQTEATFFEEDHYGRLLRGVSLRDLNLVSTDHPNTYHCLQI